MTLTTTDCKAMLLFVAKGIASNADLLNEADSMGDSDHGTGMATGFTAVQQKLNGNEFTDLGSLFKACGMAFMMSAGGASGALFGSLFKEGAKALDNLQALDSHGFAAFLETGLAAVMKRGKATVGDKTMVDALAPAVQCAQEHANEPLDTVVRLCTQAAKQGSEGTRTMRATVGRMKNLGARTVGHVDPGSISIALIFGYMEDYLALP